MHHDDASRSDEEQRSIRLWEGLKLLGLALLLALGLRTFVLEGFRIPTASMEKSLLVGDFVLVSKLHYGTRLPMSLGVPLTTWYVRDLDLPYLRLPPLVDVQRGDAIVFNYPLEEKPVDRRTHYIKRVVGLPGDTVRLIDKDVYINSRRIPMRRTMQCQWRAVLDGPAYAPVDSLRALGVAQVSVVGRHRNKMVFEATPPVAETVAAWPNVVRVEPNVRNRDPGFGLRIFPPDRGFGRDQYGPLYIPAEGDTLIVNADTWLLYKDLIIRYEGHTARLWPDGIPEIDGVRTTEYVVEQDYFFVLGDNRDSSVDSRVWGFVPMDHIVGKALLIYFSWDSQAHRPRFGRLFSGID